MRCCFLALALIVTGCADLNRAEWRRYTETLLADGYLRRDRAAPDAPYTNAVLVENFERIAFSSEAAPWGDVYDQNMHEMITKVREGPVIYIAPGAAQPRLIGPLKTLIARITALTGLEPRVVFDRPISADRNPTHAAFWVHFDTAEGFEALSNPAILAMAAGLRSVPEWTFPVAATINDWRVSDSPCGVSSYFNEGELESFRHGEIYYAMILIRSDIPDALVEACVEEEFSQALGLFDDDPTLRPSIFNDDQEFALLTSHDEALLRILYDPRLEPGMTREEAMPLVRQIVAEQRPGG